MDEAPDPDNVPVVVALSGSGRTLYNLLAHEDRYAYHVAGVIASRPDCRGCEIAREADRPLLVDDFRSSRRQSAAENVYAWLSSLGAQWVALAGFLKIFPVHPDWESRIVNIHPALLPEFGGPGMYGERVHQAVLNAGRNVSGATVHYVTSRYDEGASIAQVRVPVTPEDDPAALAARVFDAECRLYPRVLHRLIREELPLPSGKIDITDETQKTRH